MKPLANKRVLVVDDEEMLREVLCDALALLGAVTFEAPNGTAALQLVRDHKPDLVITDLRMAGGDGRALLGAIRQDPPPHPRIVICTAFSDVDSGDAEKFGAAAVFIKPFDWRKFRQAIIELMAPSAAEVSPTDEIKS